MSAKYAKRASKAKKSKGEHESLTDVLLETAVGMHRVGLLDKAEYGKITMRHPKKRFFLLNSKSVTGLQIRQMREKAHMSQGVFAQVLNITPGYVSQLERGDKEPSGSTLALLNVIKRKGVDELL